mgnify:FL=1
MIQKYKFISTINKKEVTGSQPTHYLKATKGKDDKEGVFVASLWARSYENDGVTKRFLSGQMSDAFNDKPGFVIVNEKDLDNLIARCQEMKKQLGEAYDVDYPTPGKGGNPNPDEIPF